MPDIRDLIPSISSVLSPEELKKFRPGWWRLMVFLLAGMKQTEAAAQLGIHANTVSHLWNHEPSFRKIFDFLNTQRNEKATENFSKVVQQTDEASSRAFDVLAAIMEDDEAPASVRSSNAREILHMAGHKPKERIEIESTKPIQISVSDQIFKPEDDPYELIKRRLGLTSSFEAAVNEEVTEDLAKLDTEIDKESGGAEGDF